VANTDKSVHSTPYFSFRSFHKLELTCRLSLHAFPAVGKIFHVQPVGVCMSRDLLTDRSRRLASVLLCQYWNAKALRFEVGMFCRRLLLQNKGSPKIFEWFIWRYRLYIRTLQECKFTEVARWLSTWFHLQWYLDQRVTLLTNFSANEDFFRCFLDWTNEYGFG